MADDDVRIARWDMRATAGTTVSRPFSATTAVTAVTVYTGGTVDDVDDLTGATAHEASVDPGGLSGTITVDVPTGNSVPLRLVVDGAVVTVGRLTPSTTGAATRDDTVTIAVAESSTLTLDLPSIVVNEGAGGGGGGVHPDLASHDALGLATQAELEAEQTARTTGDADTLAAAVQRANHTGTQTSTTISDFTEAVQDAVAALLGAGSNITLTYDDAADTLTIEALGDGTGLDAEAVRDAIGVALVGAGLISVAVNDALDTITITTTATANSTDAALRDRTTHTGTQSIATVTGLQAALDAKETPAGAQAKADAAEAAANTYTDNATSGVAQDADVVHDTGDETIAGVKTFTSSPVVPDASFAIVKTSGLQTALDAKAPLASPTFTGTVAGITKAMVGLANVDNTADTAKPVSTAQQSALDAKAPLASPALTGTPTAPTAAAATNTTQLATTAFVVAGFARLDGQYAVNTVATSGSTETLTLAPAHRVTMDQNCTFTFPTPAAGHTFLLWLSGAFTPTFPASVDWDSATAPTYATPSLYGFTTLDGGTSWTGTLIGSGVG